MGKKYWLLAACGSFSRPELGVCAMISDAVRKCLDLAEEKIADATELALRILRVDTTNPPGKNYVRLVGVLEAEYQQLGMKTKVITVPPQFIRQVPLPLRGTRPNLVATWQNGREPMSVYAHMDTVPVGENWLHDPFGQVDNGRIYGRGASDVKGNIAALITALKILREVGCEPHYEISALMCTDEEISGYPGVLELARRGYVRGHVLSMEGAQDIPEVCLVLQP